MSKTPDAPAGAMLAALAVILLWTPVGWWITAQTLLVLWGWFAVPLGAPTLTLSGALGLLVLRSFLWKGNAVSDQEAEDRARKEPWKCVWKGIGLTLGNCGFSLLIGWAILAVTGGPK